MSLFSFFQNHEPDGITGKFIQSSISEFRGMTQTISLENSSNSPVHDPKIEISKLDEFSSDTVWLMALKTEISKILG